MGEGGRGVGVDGNFLWFLDYKLFQPSFASRPEESWPKHCLASDAAQAKLLIADTFCTDFSEDTLMFSEDTVECLGYCRVFRTLTIVSKLFSYYGQCNLKTVSA